MNISILNSVSMPNHTGPSNTGGRPNTPNRDDFTLIALLFLTLLVFACHNVKADIADDIGREALRQGVNPQIALAVAKVESGLNPDAIGSHGEIGVFQIMPYNAPTAPLFNVNTNIHVGVSLLRKAKLQCSDMGIYWVICFNNGVNRRPLYPHLHPYWKKVMAAV